MFQDPRGFTLIELLIVILVLGLLATLALPRFVSTREKSYLAAMKTDLRNLATSEEAYFSTHLSYSTSSGDLDFRHSNRVVISIEEATSRGWRATASYSVAPDLACEIYYGEAAGASTASREGVVSCSR